MANTLMDELWFHLLSMMREGEDPELIVIHLTAILEDVSRQEYGEQALKRAYLKQQRRINRSRAKARVVAEGGTW